MYPLDEQELGEVVLHGVEPACPHAYMFFKVLTGPSKKKGNRIGSAFGTKASDSLRASSSSVAVA